MRLKAKQLEIDVVHALKSNEDVRSAWGLNERGTGGKKEGVKPVKGACHQQNKTLSVAQMGKHRSFGDEQRWQCVGGGSGEICDPARFGQSSRNVCEGSAACANSLVSLRTQVRALGREVKEMKER